MNIYECCEHNIRFATPEGLASHIAEHIRLHEMEALQQFKYTTASIKPKFGLIPYNALVALANRFQLGLEKHKDKSWNALSKNQPGLSDEDWVIARAEHVIHHAYQFILKYKGLIPDDNDDDAAGVMWGGACLSEAMRVKKSLKNNSSDVQE